MLSLDRVEIIEEGDTFTTNEFLGGGIMISNTLTFFVEGPFRFPDDAEGIKTFTCECVRKGDGGIYTMDKTVWTGWGLTLS